MKVTLAKTAGFCFGVQRAVDTVYRVLEEEHEKPLDEQRSIYTYGPIVHNETVIQKLAAEGVQVLESEEELATLRDGIVIIRAHGVPKHIYELLEKQRVEAVDASCPFVQKIQRLVQQHTAAGEEVFVTGNPEHPEVIGIMGWAEGGISAIPDIETAEKLPNGEGRSVVVVSQTTFNIDKFKLIIDILKKYLFQGHELDKEHLAEELGDVAWYLSVAADALGYSLQEIFKMNIEKLRERYPDGFEEERSINRV